MTNNFQPRRFITNFVDGSAEFHDDATPPAQEYLSLQEHEDKISGVRFHGCVSGDCPHKTQSECFSSICEAIEGAFCE